MNVKNRARLTVNLHWRLLSTEFSRASPSHSELPWLSILWVNVRDVSLFAKGELNKVDDLCLSRTPGWQPYLEPNWGVIYACLFIYSPSVWRLSLINYFLVIEAAN